jgi:NAD/NADP transhydrogenase alpha subunit
MVTVDKENLQVDASNTAEESTMEEKEATAPSVATEPDEQGATDNADSDAPQQAKSPDQETTVDGANIPDQETTGDDTKRKIAESEPPSSLALRPVKRARTAYFIFADDRRAALQAKVSCLCFVLFRRQRVLLLLNS